MRTSTRRASTTTRRSGEDEEEEDVTAAAAAAAAREGDGAVYSYEDVRAHDTGADCWVVVGDGVYDASAWVNQHPGGATVLEQYAGRDITDAFRAYHGGQPRAEARLKSLRVGSVAAGARAAPAHLAAFRKFNEKVQVSELRTKYSDYAHILFRMAILFASTLTCVLHPAAGFKTHMLGAATLGIFWQQSMFIGHDAGHTSITFDRKKDAMIGWVVGNLFNGVGIAWWMATHNVHHCACNSLECDPDIQHMPVFAVSNKYFKSVYSLYHRRQMTFCALSKMFIRVQHFTFYPIMAVARINLYAQTLIHLVKAKHVRNRGVEFFTLAMFATWLGALIHALPVGHRVPFFFLSHAVAGIIHIQICLSHFSMNVFEGRPENDEWVKMQLGGTMDITCPAWLDWFHGGLQFQTEHHLCPRMPRHKLRKFRDNVVRPYAKSNGLELKSIGFWQANVEIVRTLKQAARDSVLAPHFHAAMHL